MSFCCPGIEACSQLVDTGHAVQPGCLQTLSVPCSSPQNGAAPHKAPPASPSRIFDIQAVSREISRRFSLDDYDFNAAQDRSTRIDQIQVRDPLALLYGFSMLSCLFEQPMLVFRD